jgi:hypothetical protein
MLLEIQRRIAVAVLAGATVDAIEATIINPAPLDEDQEAALWLYAESLSGRHLDDMLSERELMQLFG